jgi:hypothetical protein
MSLSPDGRLLLGSFALAVAACTAGCAPAARTTAPPSPSPTAQPAKGSSARCPEAGPEIVRRVEAAHGLAAWRDRRAVAADIDVSFGREPLFSGGLLYDVHTGRVRLDVRDTAILFFDGERCWISPATADVPGARHHLLMWPALMAAAFRLRDPGTRLETTGPRALDGIQHETALLTFDAGAGGSPGDWFVLYEDPETNRLAAIAYAVTWAGMAPAAAGRGPRSIVYRDFVTIDGVTLAQRWTFHRWSADEGPHGDPIGSATLGNLRFVEPVPRAFAVPADVREDRLPPQAVARNLEAFLEGRLAAEELRITYSDHHGLWGGLTLTVMGTGRVRQEAVRPSEQPPGPRSLDAEEVRQIVRLLLELSAWEQRTPQRTPRPDESRARLHIRAGAAQSTIWEWFNDLDANDRIVRVRERMKDLAWPSP